MQQTIMLTKNRYYCLANSRKNAAQQLGIYLYQALPNKPK